MIMLIISAASVSAQTDDDYRMEIGGGLGLTGYLGDFNGNVAKDLKPMFTVVLRRNLDHYMALKLAVSYGKLNGSSTESKTYYAEYAGSRYEFNNTIADVDICYEYNFWPYGTGNDYRGARRFTPYVSGGIGATYCGGSSDVFTANIPLGVGLKYKIGERLNAGLEWAMHFSLSDKLDGIKDPYGITSSGLFKNTDCYSSLLFTITYSFMPKCTTCNKE
jgi:hypothetical protein